MSDTKCPFRKRQEEKEAARKVLFSDPNSPEFKEYLHYQTVTSPARHVIGKPIFIGKF